MKLNKNYLNVLGSVSLIVSGLTLSPTAFGASFETKIDAPQQKKVERDQSQVEEKKSADEVASSDDREDGEPRRPFHHFGKLENRY